MRNSKIILARGIKLDKSYNNVLTYTNNQLLELLRKQEHLLYEGNDYSFINEFQNIICVQVPYDLCLTMNYMAFQNPRYGEKWFFCFIDKVEYNSEKSTNIYFHIDSWSTWYEKINFLDCYTIREHVQDDTIGKHTIEENLQVQEVINDGNIITDNALDQELFICVTSNWSPENEYAFNGAISYTKNVFGSNIYLFRLDDDGIYYLEHFLYIVNMQEHIADIHEIFIVPSFLIPSDSYTPISFYYGPVGSEVDCVTAKIRYDSVHAYEPIKRTYNINKKTSFNDYQCKNNKCYCYPYNYLLATNNVGSQNIYKYEDFTSSKCNFELQMSLSIGASARVVPLNYKSYNRNYSNIEESLTVAKYPTCSWSSDAYVNWLTSTAVNISQEVLGTKATNIIGKAGEVISGFLPNIVQGAVGDFSKELLLPQVTGGNSTGDVNFANGNQAIRFIPMRAKTECIKIIDNYFSKFGYKVVEVKKPAINSRRYWNYIQIGNGEIFASGNIPQDDLQTINSIAQSGVTMWHDHDAIGNYSLSNSIV